MLLKLTAPALFALSLTVIVSACGGPPKQAEVADDTRETGMEGNPEGSANNQPTDSPPAEEAAQMHAKCCAECKAGLEKDRSGAAPNTIPCSDFTDTLSPWCLEHFRGKPTMADACAKQ